MSQNQNYFWQTSRRNVYIRRVAKLQILLALMAALMFSTICAAETELKLNDISGGTMGAPTRLSAEETLQVKSNINGAGQGLESSNGDEAKESKSKNGFIDAFTASISVILLTELGDKTFFIAAIMAMRHPRLIVFAGAITALALMTILSVVFGMAATIIPKVYTYYISTALFAIFGLKMIYEGYFMKDTDAQEELEEVQSDLRKREDELMRLARAKYEDPDSKRKNSKSDKEEKGVKHIIGAPNDNKVVTVHSASKNPEMQHRQRKQLNYSNNINNNGCEINNDEDSDECFENDVFLNGEKLKMATFHSSPALSASASSSQTNQTNCDDLVNTPRKLLYTVSNGNVNGNSEISQFNKPGLRTGSYGYLNSAALVHTNSVAATLQSDGKVASKANSINSLSSISLNSATAAGQPNSELKQFGGNKKRLERDVTATLVQDPESGVVRKSVKRGAAYLTTRIMMQAFTLTFLAEWGDRSQLTTIILAASKDIYGVTIGGILGHSICTGLAVVGGRMVAAKISVRTVTIVGGIVFLGFALYALLVRPDDI